MLGMALSAQGRASRKQRIISICAWAFVILLDVWQLMTRPHVMHFLMGLGILVGALCIFREVNFLLQEPE
jgi:hypothetical protein